MKPTCVSLFHRVSLGWLYFFQQMMSSAFRKELQKFDAERVLPAWDGLVSKQQTALENLGVPTMFNTGLDTDKEVCCAATSGAGLDAKGHMICQSATTSSGSGS